MRQVQSPTSPRSNPVKPLSVKVSLDLGQTNSESLLVLFVFLLCVCNEPQFALHSMRSRGEGPASMASLSRVLFHCSNCWCSSSTMLRYLKSASFWVDCRSVCFAADVIVSKLVAGRGRTFVLCRCNHAAKPFCLLSSSAAVTACFRRRLRLAWLLALRLHVLRTHLIR